MVERYSPREDRSIQDFGEHEKGVEVITQDAPVKGRLRLGGANQEEPGKELHLTGLTLLNMERKNASANQEEELRSNPTSNSPGLR